MKILLSLVLLLALISSCVVYESTKTERTMVDIEKKETGLQGDVDREQQDIDRVSKEIEELKKDTAN